LDEIQGLRKKTETELKLTTTPLNATSKNINTSWNKDVGVSHLFILPDMVLKTLLGQF